MPESSPTPDPASAASQRRTALASLIAAAVLVVLKLGTGLAAGSLALISAGVESSGDVIAALLTLLAIRMALQPADRDHNYGHRRAENLAALGEAAIVAGGGLVIAFEAIRQLADASGDADSSWYVFVVIGLAVAIDVSRITISLRAARRHDSAAFRSNAMNFASDLAGSLAVLVGLALVAAGAGAGDAIAALVVSIVIFVAAARLIRENTRALMDYAPPSSRDAISRAIADTVPAVEVRRLRLREAGGRTFADVTLGVPPASAVTASHDLADRVEQAVREAVPASDVVVHVEPAEDGVDLRERILALALADPDVADAHDVAIFTSDRGAIVSLHLKLDPTCSLQVAHEAAERVEAQAGRLDGVLAVHTHLEPLEAPIPLRSPPSVRDARRQSLRATVAELTGHDPEELEVLDTDAGPVLFVTIGVRRGERLVDAHAAAGDLERLLRDDHPGLAEVVVHTEPTG